MLSTADSIVACKSFSLCWIFLLKSSFICVLFSAIFLLSLFDVSDSLSCNSSFKVVVVKSTDSSYYISSSFAVSSATNGILFCRLFSRIFGNA